MYMIYLVFIYLVFICFTFSVIGFSVIGKGNIGNLKNKGKTLLYNMKTDVPF